MVKQTERVRSARQHVRTGETALGSGFSPCCSGLVNDWEVTPPERCTHTAVTNWAGAGVRQRPWLQRLPGRVAELRAEGALVSVLPRRPSLCAAGVNAGEESLLREHLP